MSYILGFKMTRSYLEQFKFWRENESMATLIQIFFFPRQKLSTKQLSVHLFLLMLLCVTLFHSLCVVSSRTPCVENECPTWSQSRSCSWFHCVCWADDHRTAEPHLPPLAHTHTKRKFPLFAHRSECFNEHHLQRQLQEKGVRLK